MQVDDVYNSHRERVSTSITFRIDQDSVKRLRAEAQKQGISLNSFVNQILKNFLEWHIFEPKVRFVPILKPVVKEVFAKISKEQIKEIAETTGKDEFQNAVYFMNGKINLDAFLSWFENRMKNSSVR